MEDIWRKYYQIYHRWNFSLSFVNIIILKCCENRMGIEVFNFRNSYVLQRSLFPHPCSRANILYQIIHRCISLSGVQGGLSQKYSNHIYMNKFMYTAYLNISKIKFRLISVPKFRNRFEYK